MCLDYCYHVYFHYSHPSELQSLTWWLPLAGSIVYGCMIYFGKMSMKNRAPISPKNSMLIYNIYQSLINGFMAVWLCYSAYRAGFSIWGNYEDTTAGGFNIAFGMWMHYNNKVRNSINVRSRLPPNRGWRLVLTIACSPFFFFFFSASIWSCLIPSSW